MNTTYSFKLHVCIQITHSNLRVEIQPTHSNLSVCRQPILTDKSKPNQKNFFFFYCQQDCRVLKETKVSFSILSKHTRQLIS